MPERRRKPSRRGPGGLGWFLLCAVAVCGIAALAVFVVPVDPVVTTVVTAPAPTPAPVPVPVPPSTPPAKPAAPEPQVVAAPRPVVPDVAIPVAPAASVDMAWPPALLIPVEGVAARDLRDTFNEGRDGNQRGHEAIDIAAPVGTPVRAVDDGRIAKLFLSKPGGITIYEFNASRTLAYYYAHLDRYAPGLAEGQEVRRGTVIGYVGTTGNAPPGAPHLHFAIFRLGPQKKWWQGEPINPYGYLGGTTR